MPKLLFQNIDILYTYRSFYCSRSTRSLAWFTPLEHFTFRKTKNSYHLNNTLKYLSSNKNYHETFMRRFVFFCDIFISI